MFKIILPLKTTLKDHLFKLRCYGTVTTLKCHLLDASASVSVEGTL